MLEDLGAATPSLPSSPAGDASSPWPDDYPRGYAVVDVETTGLSRRDRIVSAAVYRLDARGGVEDHWYSLVNPRRDPGPTWIHGLTSEMLADAPTFPEIAGELAERLTGRVLVAHHADFDWSMLVREYARARVTIPVRQRLCTIALAKALALPLANQRLASLAAYYGVRQQRAHDALDDARVLTEIFRRSLHAAAGRGLALPLLACRPLTEWSESSGVTVWRRRRGGRTCPYPNPGRYAPGGRLVQGMRVAFSGDTTIERELLEDRAFQAGLHVTGSVSRLTSLLVTNDPEASTNKVTRARAHGTPIVDEAAFTDLLRDVAPAPRSAPPSG